MSVFDELYLHTTAAGPFLAAIATYLAFLIIVFVAKVGRGKTPILNLSRLHVRMTAVYAVLAIALMYWFGTHGLVRAVLELGIGAFLYLGLHYAVGANIFGLAYASVSASLVSTILSHGGRISRQALAQSYGGGAGFDQVKRSRMERLETFLGWVRSEAPSTGGEPEYVVTQKGQRALRLMRFFLRLWGLTQLGGVRA